MLLFRFYKTVKETKFALSTNIHKEVSTCSANKVNTITSTNIHLKN
jgi:hypothetical protein